MNEKIIYYYQNVVGLDNLLSSNCKNVTHINISSIHFGVSTNTPDKLPLHK